MRAGGPIDATCCGCIFSETYHSCYYHKLVTAGLVSAELLMTVASVLYFNAFVHCALNELGQTHRAEPGENDAENPFPPVEPVL